MVYIGSIFLFLAALMQSVVLPQAVPLSVRPHLLVLLVVAVCLVESMYEATLWAFIGGLMLDLMSGPAFPLGSHALMLLLVALLASIGQANPFHNRLFVPLVTVFVATFFYHMMVMGLFFALGQYEMVFVESVLRVALPSAILNAILTPVAYSGVLWLSEKTGRRVQVEW